MTKWNEACWFSWAHCGQCSAVF